MRWILLYVCVPLLCCSAVNNMKSLTESMGQEVIEMDSPKELPPYIEEEPSAERDIDIKPITTLLPATKINLKKSSTTKENQRRNKEAEKIDSLQQEEEARIEKELADLYKDSADYKADSAEISKEPSEATNATTQALPEVTTEVTDKPIARAGNEFKFQPDSYNFADVERFRTSIDIIRCDRNRLSGTTKSPSSSGHRYSANVIIIAIFFSKTFLNL
ncbi:unnamed protein product [Parnassius mnemosyne]|uniref:Uncharacterized protein n=1 Tax=Parnassius mnemosyne TaxID=213953 RepID=A0AAV1LA60_9NEOP